MAVTTTVELLDKFAQCIAATHSATGSVADEIAIMAGVSARVRGEIHAGY